MTPKRSILSMNPFNKYLLKDFYVVLLPDTEDTNTVKIRVLPFRRILKSARKDRPINILLQKNKLNL